MNDCTTESYYAIIQSIDNVEHYYSHWEKLHNAFAPYGIVWTEVIGTACFFKKRSEAKKMLKRIKQYDPRTKAILLPVSVSNVLIEQERARNL